MAFEGLGAKLQETFRKLKGKGKLSEADIKEAMKEVKRALLEADVNFRLVKDFIKTVSEKATGSEVMESLTPGQMVVKIVNDELTNLMGGNEAELNIESGLCVVMMAGLQGAGKTTISGKLALHLRKKNKRPLLVACDVYRPAAIKQLEVIGKQIDIPVFSMGDKVSPVDIAKAGVNHARKEGLNVVIIDTAGRLQIDEEMMEELKEIKAAVKPSEILLVVDAMTGQEAVNVAKTFDEALDVGGVVLTKLDGDTKGGAALSIKAITGKPIKLIGVGEKMSDLEVFHPERMASRILGMGDVLSLIEKAQAAIDEKDATELAEKMMKAEFTLEDYLKSMEQMKKMGPMSKMLEMMPGMDKNAISDDALAKGEKELKKMESIIYSMTVKERRNPALVEKNNSRKKRIANGSGVSITDVNKLLKQYDMMRKMMKQMKGGKGLFGQMMKGKGKGLGSLLGGKLPF